MQYSMENHLSHFELLVPRTDPIIAAFYDPAYIPTIEDKYAIRELLLQWKINYEALSEDYFSEPPKKKRWFQRK